MKKIIISILFCLLIGCNSKTTVEYQRISPQKAQVLMDEMIEPYVLLDVRTVDEYKERHIVNAINIPLDELEELANVKLIDKDQPIFVYCRSGNRSQEGSQILVDLGYTNVIEMGGINDWEGKIIE